MHHTGALKSIFQFFGTVPTANEIAAGRHAPRPDIDHLSQSLDYKVRHPRHPRDRLLKTVLPGVYAIRVTFLLPAPLQLVDRAQYINEWINRRGMVPLY